MRSIYQTILEQIRMGSGIVLATVVRTSGSTPQKPGSSALFGEAGLLAGTVGGGLLEGEVEHIAHSVMISETSDHFYFNLNSDQGEEGAICGGEAEVLVDASPSSYLETMEAMEAAISERHEGYLLTVVSKKHEQGRTIARYWIKGLTDEKLPSELNPALIDAIPAHLKQAIRYGFVEVEFHPTGTGVSDMAFLEHIKPKPQLVIAGGGHVGKALAHLGNLLEFEVTVIDDRQEYVNTQNIPDADHLVPEEIGSALEKIGKGPDTYIVVVTRGHNHDSEALKSCIGSDAAYIGMIGSAHKVEVMKHKFLENSWATPEQWAAVHTPIGIAIGSKTVQEIAISIAAQLVEIRSKKIAAYAK